MLENKYVEAYDCHYSRFIASWFNAGGKQSCQFERWLLREFPLLTEHDRKSMANMMTCGKLEMEISAKNFLTDCICDSNYEFCDYLNCEIF